MGQAPPAAPQDFRLVTVTQDKGEAPPPGPAPVPQQKPTLEAIDRQVLQSVDDHAIQVSGTSSWYFNLLLRLGQHSLIFYQCRMTAGLRTALLWSVCMCIRIFTILQVNS